MGPVPSKPNYYEKDCSIETKKALKKLKKNYDKISVHLLQSNDLWREHVTFTFFHAQAVFDEQNMNYALLMESDRKRGSIIIERSLGDVIPSKSKISRSQESLEMLIHNLKDLSKFYANLLGNMDLVDVIFKPLKEHITIAADILKYMGYIRYWTLVSMDEILSKDQGTLEYSQQSIETYKEELGKARGEWKRNAMDLAKLFSGAINKYNKDKYTSGQRTKKWINKHTLKVQDTYSLLLEHLGVTVQYLRGMDIGNHNFAYVNYTKAITQIEKMSMTILAFFF